jgi:hypothetical protein
MALVTKPLEGSRCLAYLSSELIEMCDVIPILPSSWDGIIDGIAHPDSLRWKWRETCQMFVL